jgi:hypothetical protein
VEQEKLRRDVALAAEVQRRLLPGHPPKFAGGVLAALSLPARSVGGDYYDFLDLGDHQIGIALADIAGKGVAAALIMAVVQASLRIVAAEEGTSLPELAAKMNGFLHRSTGSKRYATFFNAQHDERSRARYVNAAQSSTCTAGEPRGMPIYSPRSSCQSADRADLSADDLWSEATVELRSGDSSPSPIASRRRKCAEEEFARSGSRAASVITCARICPCLTGCGLIRIRRVRHLTFVVMKVNPMRLFIGQASEASSVRRGGCRLQERIARCPERPAALGQLPTFVTVCFWKGLAPQIEVLIAR